MLLGEYCGLDINITKAMHDEAIRRVHKMKFVGLTDAFNASVCLFHHTFGGTPEEYMFTTHTRNGKHLAKRKELQCGLGLRVDSSSWEDFDSMDVDPYDTMVYEAARSVFSARLQEAGLWGGDYKRLKYICRDTHRRQREPCQYR